MRSIPEDNLSYPVLIALGARGSGSGFLLNSPTELYLVTARHVLYKEDSKTKKAFNLLASNATCSAMAKDLKTKIDLALDLTQLEKDGNIKPHPDADVAIIEIGQLDKGIIAESPGVDISSATPGGGGLLGVRAATCYKFDEVFVANDVFVFGYPKSIGLPGQLDPDRPLLRKGIVADKDPNKEHIVIDCPVYQGNSGGLAMEVREVALGKFESHPIGVVTSFVPFVELLQSLHYKTMNQNIENSGYAIVTPIDRVFELI